LVNASVAAKRRTGASRKRVASIPPWTGGLLIAVLVGVQAIRARRRGTARQEVGDGSIPDR